MKWMKKMKKKMKKMKNRAVVMYSTYTSFPTVSGLITGVNESKEPELRFSDALSRLQPGPETYFCRRPDDRRGLADSQKHLTLKVTWSQGRYL